MRGGSHRLARLGIIIASAAAAMWLLARPHPSVPLAPPVIEVRALAAPAPVAAEPLFEQAAIDAAPAGRSSGPPQLIGIVGRIAAPMAMIRVENGAIRTIGPGQAAAGWTLESVVSDRAIFRRGGETRVSVLPPRDAAQ